jgi:hypothetical protein
MARPTHSGTLKGRLVVTQIVGFVLVAFLSVAFMTLSPVALAQDDAGPDGDDQIILTGRLVVPEGETVETAILFSGDAIIDGTVAGWLVVFNGRTEITGTVDEDVVVFAGDVVLRSGSRVGGDVISLEDPQIEEGATIGGSVDELEIVVLQSPMRESSPSSVILRSPMPPHLPRCPPALRLRATDE